MGDWCDGHTIGLLPERAALQWGAREALAFQGQRWTFAELSARVDAVAKGLIQLGIAPGDKVALWMVNHARDSVHDGGEGWTAGRGDTCPELRIGSPLLLRAAAAPVDHVVLDAACLPGPVRAERAPVRGERIRRLLSDLLSAPLPCLLGSPAELRLVVPADGAARGHA